MPCGAPSSQRTPLRKSFLPSPRTLLRKSFLPRKFTAQIHYTLPLQCDNLLLGNLLHLTIISMVSHRAQNLPPAPSWCEARGSEAAHRARTQSSARSGSSPAEHSHLRAEKFEEGKAVKKEVLSKEIYYTNALLLFRTQSKSCCPVKVTFLRPFFSGALPQ